MDRTALQLRAAEVRRRIFASLPWQLRLAVVLTQVAADTGYLLDWARAFGAKFLLAGVEGMPDPGPRWNPNAHDPAMTLPRGYMANFMHAVWGTILKNRWANPQLAEEAIARYLMKMQEGKIHIDKEKAGGGLSSAESYVKWGILQEAKTLAKKQRREWEHGQSLEDVGEESKSISMDIEDPESLSRYQHVLSPRMWKEWMDYLARHIHPDMPLFLKLRMEGYDNNEIVGDPKRGINDTMLPHYKAQGHPMKSDPTYWGDKMTKKLIPMSQEFFKQHGDELREALM